MSSRFSGEKALGVPELCRGQTERALIVPWNAPLLYRTFPIGIRGHQWLLRRATGEYGWAD
jgi:hypothetical protein